VVGQIAQRSTGRQKQARFLPIGKLLVKERYHPKEIPFLLLRPVSLVVIFFFTNKIGVSTCYLG